MSRSSTTHVIIKGQGSKTEREVLKQHEENTLKLTEEPSYGPKQISPPKPNGPGESGMLHSK